MRESSSSVWLWSFESKSKIAQRTDFSPTHTLGYTDLKSQNFSFHQLIYPFARHTFKLHLRFVSWRIRKEADTQQLRRSTLTWVEQVATQADCCVKAAELEMSRNATFSMWIPTLPLSVVCLFCRPSGLTSLWRPSIESCANHVNRFSFRYLKLSQSPELDNSCMYKCSSPSFPGDGDGQEWQWWAGANWAQLFPLLSSLCMSCESRNLVIQANGHELTHIAARLMCQSKSVAS